MRAQQSAGWATNTGADGLQADTAQTHTWMSLRLPDGAFDVESQGVWEQLLGGEGGTEAPLCTVTGLGAGGGEAVGRAPALCTLYSLGTKASPLQPPHRPANQLTTEASVWLPLGTALSVCPLQARLSSWDPTSGLRTPATCLAKSECRCQAQAARGPGPQAPPRASAATGWWQGRVQPGFLP